MIKQIVKNGLQVAFFFKRRLVQRISYWRSAFRIRYLNIVHHARISPTTYVAPRFIVSWANGLEIGDDCVIQTNFISCGKVKLGRGVIIAPNCSFFAQTHAFNHAESIPFGISHTNKPIVVDDYVWIGANVIVLGGVHIGEGVVISAGSVVSSDVEPFSVVAGNPAKTVFHRDADFYLRLKKENKIFTRLVYKREPGLLECLHLNRHLRQKWATRGYITTQELEQSGVPNYMYHLRSFAMENGLALAHFGTGYICYSDKHLEILKQLSNTGGMTEQEITDLSVLKAKEQRVVQPH
ncbi:acyltransferase [candidate division KSB1 bacterium]|nr:acyltransferase [candidate division KSB1 bacterium]